VNFLYVFALLINSKNDSQMTQLVPWTVLPPQ